MIKPDEKLRRIKKASHLLKDSLQRCEICPRKCRVDRTRGKKGYCRAPLKPVVYSYGPHHGEEPALSGTHGSGTIFFSHCNMKCVYCQNYRFSQLDEGKEVSTDRLSEIMLSLQKQGCHNINLVSPTHFVPQILIALEKALEGGLAIPIVYNTSGYELPETVRMLKDIVDIYLPDMRYSDEKNAKKYSDAENYVRHNRESVKEMFDQVGNLVSDEAGAARKGLIIRLLVLPNDISGTARTLKYIRDVISADAYLSIMSQYYPAFKSCDYPDLSSRLESAEYKNIVDASRDLGLNNGWAQEAPGETDPKFFGTNIRPR